MNILDGESPTENTTTNTTDSTIEAPADGVENATVDNPTQTSEPPKETTEVANWFDSLSEDTRKAEGFDGIKDKFKSTDDLALAYINAQKLIGKKTDGTKLPTAESEKDEWDNLYNELGRPKDPTEYKMPDDIDLDVDSELLVGRNASLHELGLTQTQYDGIMNMYAEEFGRIQDTFVQSEHQVVRESEKALKEDWGNDYDKNIKLVANTADKFGIKEELMESGLINHLPVLKMLHKVGNSMQEDGVVKTPDSGYNRSDEIKQIRNSKAFLDRSHPDHEAVVEKLVKLYQ